MTSDEWLSASRIMGHMLEFPIKLNLITLAFHSKISPGFPPVVLIQLDSALRLVDECIVTVPVGRGPSFSTSSSTHHRKHSYRSTSKS